MQNKLRFLGMDVHAETTAVAIAEADGLELVDRWQVAAALSGSRR
jgi:hypothetical protein